MMREPPPNNGLHPTRDTLPVMLRERLGRAGDARVSWLRVMRTHKFWVPVVCSLVVTPIVLFMGAASAGGRHGRYFLVKLLFPYTMLSAATFGVIYLTFAFLALAHCPAYGLVLGYSKEKVRCARWAAILSAAHCVAATAALLLGDEKFS